MENTALRSEPVDGVAKDLETKESPDRTAKGSSSEISAPSQFMLFQK